MADIDYNLLSVAILTPESVLFEGKLKAISSMNDTGPFDILPQHENFISIIKNKVILFDESNNKRELKLENGIIEVFEGKVQIFLGIESL